MDGAALPGGRAQAALGASPFPAGCPAPVPASAPIGAPVPRARREASVVARAEIRHDAPDAMARLRAALGPAPLELVLLFATPLACAATLAREAARAFGDTPVIGCTTAGEIGARGYAEGEVVAVGFPRAHFRGSILAIEGLGRLDPRAVTERVTAARAGLVAATPGLGAGFAFLMVDGLSAAEDALASAIASGLGPMAGPGGMPLVGGSAGDGGRYGRTFVIHGGRAVTDAAVLALLRTDCRARAFQTDHLIPTGTRMVVTGADPARRLVTEIDAEPAAAEYARLLGREVCDLTPYAFAAHPLVVRAGGRHHVRAIQRVEGGALKFFSAIEVGLVLTLAQPGDMAAHLERELSALSRGGAPDAILACDCTLRRVEAEERQLGGALSAILARHRAAGFSTYGEQMGAMHVNQTLTGVAIYPPDGSAPGPRAGPGVGARDEA